MARITSVCGVAGRSSRLAPLSSCFVTHDQKRLPREPFLMVLHVGVVRSAGTFGRDPGDVLRRVLDVAGLAVHAVLRVDLEALAAIVVAHDLVNARSEEHTSELQ